MLILLPPSEGKSAPDAGPSLDLAGLSFPTLTTARRQVLSALVTLCRGDVSVASEILGLGPTQRGEVGANTRLRREPCAPAIDVYTGVLYEHLDASSLRGRARERLDTHVVIASALWGLASPGDLIPAYRLSGGTTLPGIGPLAHTWREPITRVLRDVDGLIVDLRSGAYAALAPVPTDLVARTATIRVLTERSGKRTVVSHSNKATKGLVVRELMRSRRTPRDVDALADVIATAGFRVEVPDAPSRGATTIDVIVD